MAVDDTVRSVLRPFGRKIGSKIDLFSAILPEQVLTPGERSLEVLLVDWSAGSPRLYRPQGDGAASLPPNLAMTPLPGLEIQGFYPAAIWGESPTRWTDGAGILFLDAASVDQATQLRLRLADAASAEDPLLVTVNGVPLLAQPAGDFPLLVKLPLTDVEIMEEVRIGIFSSTFVPAESQATSNDRRRLGVAVQEITLADAEGQIAASTTPVTPPDWVMVRPQDSPDAELAGFHNAEPWNDEPCAWTTGRAEVRVDWPHAEFPDHLLVSLGDAGPHDPQLRIEVNGARVYPERLDQGPHLELIDLEGVPHQEPLRITLTSDTFRPSRYYEWSDDDRELGVAVRLLTLIGLEDPTGSSDGSAGN